MKWLEQHGADDTEKWLGEALKAARQRTGDEVARRRVWARIEGLLSGNNLPLLRARSLVLPALTGALVALGVVAALWMVPAMRPARAPVAAKRVAPAVASAPQPGLVATRVVSQISSSAPVRTGRGEKARVALVGGTGVELDANSVLSWDAERRPSVERGQARFEVPHQAPGARFAVSAGPYVISVVGTKFHVGVGDDRVSVEVEEGVVEVWRGARSVRLVEGDSWAGPIRGLAPPGIEHRTFVPGTTSRRAALADSPARIENGPASAELTEARSALSEGRTEEALAMLTHCAKGVGPAAENAAYEMGRVLRDGLHRPQAAVTAWLAYRTRFPNGLLRAEADLSILETLARVGDKAAALAEAESFLARYPNSERREEVAKLAARVRGAP
ncbi:MAG: FecR domain-containing protein [Polyangia bacterium]|jgi:ferric-dicitrate binding protein FerR (iron transport regulator)